MMLKIEYFILKGQSLVPVVMLSRFFWAKGLMFSACAMQQGENNARSALVWYFSLSFCFL